jgi:hypothetical protein
MREFVRPFALGAILFWMTLLTEMLTVFYLSTISVTIDVIIKQVCLAAVAKVSIFYAASLS